MTEKELNAGLGTNTIHGIKDLHHPYVEEQMPILRTEELKSQGACESQSIYDHVFH